MENLQEFRDKFQGSETGLMAEKQVLNHLRDNSIMELFNKYGVVT